MAKVSVIVPVYNVEDYLSGAVESLLRQTEEDIEIILVDDGSKDKSGALCDKLAGEDARIKVLHKENGGLSSARNAGVKIAASEYVMFLDGDDYLCDDAVETLLKISDIYSPDIVQFRYREVRKTGKQGRHDTEMRDTFIESRPKVLFRNLYNLGGMGASGCTKLIKRQLALNFPFESVMHEDEMWCTRVLAKGVTVVYIPDILYFYVMREGSIIHTAFNRDKLDIFKVEEERINTLTGLGLYDLAEREYAKMFLSILCLYKEASGESDFQSCSIIREQFKKNVGELLENSFIKGKYKILLYMMTAHFSFVKLYVRFKEMKQKKASKKPEI